MAMATATANGTVNFRWDWLAPTFRSALVERVARDAVGIAGAVVATDGAALVEAGCVHDWAWQAGRLVAASTVDALIACRRKEALALVAEAGPNASFFKLVGDAPAPSTIAYLLVLAFGDTTHVRAQLCAAAGAAPSVDVLCATAKAWRHLLHDAEEAGRWLATAEQKSDATAGFLAVAEARGSVQGDAGEIIRCLRLAQGRATKLVDTLALARGWLTLAGDEEATREALERATALAHDSTTLAACSRAWHTLLPQAPEARALLAEAEAVVQSGADLAACAALHRDVFGDDEGARRTIDAASARAAFGAAAAAWKSVFGDDAAAQKTLQEAEEKGDAEALAGCAEAWKTVLGDDDRGRRTLQLAETRATSCKAWGAVAAAWKRTFAETAEVKRCLGEMEKRAASTVDWTECAAQSLEVDDAEGARRCLGRGEEAAKVSADFLAVAYVSGSALAATPTSSARCWKRRPAPKRIVLSCWPAPPPGRPWPSTTRARKSVWRGPRRRPPS